MYAISQFIVSFQMFVIILYCSFSRDIIDKFFEHLYKKEDISCNLIDKGMVSNIIYATSHLILGLLTFVIVPF
jgi:hypothetical protein